MGQWRWNIIVNKGRKKEKYRKFRVVKGLSNRIQLMSRIPCPVFVSCLASDAILVITIPESLVVFCELQQSVRHPCHVPVWLLRRLVFIIFWPSKVTFNQIRVVGESQSIFEQHAMLNVYIQVYTNSGLMGTFQFTPLKVNV